jgi:hypothetical protein
MHMHSIQLISKQSFIAIGSLWDINILPPWASLINSCGINNTPMGWKMLFLKQIFYLVSNRTPDLVDEVQLDQIVRPHCWQYVQWLRRGWALYRRSGWKAIKTNMKIIFFFKFFSTPNTVNSYFVPQGHKARTWVMPQGPNSVITCRIDLKLGGNVSPDLADKMHFESWPYDHPSGIYFKKYPWAITQVFALCLWAKI